MNSPHKSMTTFRRYVTLIDTKRTTYMDVNRTKAMRCSKWRSPVLRKRKKKVSRITVLIVTFALVGNTKCRRRQRQTERFSHPFGLCHNPGRVKNFHPRHKSHCQVWGGWEKNITCASQCVFQSSQVHWQCNLNTIYINQTDREDHTLQELLLCHTF